MDKDKRKGDTPIPDDLKNVLNETQRRALPGIQLSGWEPRFLRRPLFQEPEIIMHNINDNRTGILDTDGSIVQTGIKVRSLDKSTQSQAQIRPLVWTK